MRNVATILGLVVVLGGGYFIYQTTERNRVQAPPPQQQIDVVAIRSGLLALGQAERQYLVTHETYATLEQLQRENLTTVGAESRGYVFTVTVDGSRGFTITATPSDANKPGWPTLAIDDTMQMTER